MVQEVLPSLNVLNHLQFFLIINKHIIILCMHYFLKNRVVDDWNSLTHEAIDSTKKNLFKNRIDKILKL